MAYGTVNVPGVSGQELDAVRTAAQAAQSAAGEAKTAAQNAQSAANTAQSTANMAKAAAVTMKGATSGAAGAAGLAPAPAAGAQGKYLRGDGTWQTPPDTNTTYSAATQSAAGLMSAADKQKLDGVAAGANAYSLPAATASVRGGVKIGYTASGKNYPVQLSNEQMYVNVPWTDTNTTYSNMGAATASAAGKAGLVPAPAAGAQGKYLRGDGTWQTPPDTNTTYTPASAAPKAAGTAAVGTSAKYAREDHVHPAQTAVSGNAGTATKLATARAINGTNFDGSAAVTTAKWGTARNLTVGGTAKSVDGSGNVSWTLDEIGAASKTHTHTQFAANLTVGNLELKSAELRCKTGDLDLSAQEDKNINLWGQKINCLNPYLTGNSEIVASAFTKVSARRFKENFSDITCEEAERLLMLAAKHFDYIHGEKGQSGFIAEEVEPLFPEVCAYGQDAGSGSDAPVRLQGLDYSKFIPYMIKLLQVQQSRIAALEAAKRGEE